MRAKPSGLPSAQGFELHEVMPINLLLLINGLPLSPEQTPVPSAPEYAHNVPKSSKIAVGKSLRHSPLVIVSNTAYFNPVNSSYGKSGIISFSLL